MRDLQISESAREYLSQFCAERNQGRSGKLHWDAFLANVLESAVSLPAADLHSWLQENLKDKEQIETAVDDYQRIERLFDQAQKIAREFRSAKGQLDAPQSGTEKVSPTDKGTADSVLKSEDVFPDMLRFASSLWSSITTATLPGAGRTLPDYVPPTYKSNHETILKKLHMPAVAGSLPLGTLIDSKDQASRGKLSLAIPPDLHAENPHMLVVGGMDRGKTRFLAGLIAHDIEENDRAVVVVDSSGDLVRLLMRWMSRHPSSSLFEQRVILLDPSSVNERVAYNPLELDDIDLQSAASAVVSGFKAIYSEPPGSQSQWNAQTANILRNSALLLMANGKTLMDLPTLLQDNDFRDSMLENLEKRKKEKVEFITLLDTWGQYKRLARTDQWINWVEPILSRVGPTLCDPRIRPILTRAQGGIKLTSLIKNKQILLVKIARGQLDQNANLLGSLIVAATKQAALTLSGGPAQKPVSLYIDEFENLIDLDTFEAITTETERYQMGLVGSIQSLQHLPEDVRTKIISNVGSWCCFALSKKDANLLAPMMFRVDGTKVVPRTMANFFASPHFELIEDKEQLNIERLMGQDKREFYMYRVGTVAGVFHLQANDFPDMDDKAVDWDFIQRVQTAPAGYAW
jgi:hypothetical protein